MTGTDAVTGADAPAAERADSVQCYSDHNEDIRTKGSCDCCGDTEPQ